MDKLFLISKPHLRGTTLPTFYYTFAENEDDATNKVLFKWGECDDKGTVKEINGKELENLAIATDYFG